MIGEEAPSVLYIFIIIYAIIILAVAIFIQLYFTRKGTSLFINILSSFLWFTMLLVILLFPLDLFSGSLFGDDEDNSHRMQILSAFLYWNFYICGFLIIDQIKGYITNGNFTVTSKILSCLKGMGFFMIFFVGIGMVLDWIFQFCEWAFGENNFLTVAMNIIKTVIGMPMFIAYLMFLGCSLGDIPRDLYRKFNYQERIKMLCWGICHAVRKYKSETEFIVLSINKIKMAQEKTSNLNMEDLDKQIYEAKDNMNQEENPEEKKNKKNKYESLSGLKELSGCQNEMNEVLEHLENTAKIFNLNIPLETIDKEDEKRPLKNKDELVSIYGTYKIFCTQIYRINYQKYSIYKEWAEIKSFLQQGLNTESTPNISNSNDLTGDIDEQNDNETKKQSFEFRSVKLTSNQFNYYKYMPTISIVLIILCVIYGILMIIGQFEYTFKWDFITGKIFRWIFTNIYIITPIRLLPIYFTLYSVCYSFVTLRSDTNSCVYANRQTEPCHAVFFVGMIAKLICPLVYNFIEIMYNGVDLKGSESKMCLYFEEQFGFLNSAHVVIFISKLVLLALFLKAIILNLIGCYANTAHNKHQFLTYNATYIEKRFRNYGRRRDFK